MQRMVHRWQRTRHNLSRLSGSSREFHHHDSYSPSLLSNDAIPRCPTARGNRPPQPPQSVHSPNYSVIPQGLTLDSNWRGGQRHQPSHNPSWCCSTPNPLPGEPLSNGLDAAAASVPVSMETAIDQTVHALSSPSRSARSVSLSSSTSVSTLTETLEPRRVDAPSSRTRHHHEDTTHNL